MPVIHNSIPKYFKFTKSQKKNINVIICPPYVDYLGGKKNLATFIYSKS